MNGVVYATRVPDEKTGQPREIIEIWIEQIGICINEINGAFRNGGPRPALNHFGTFNIADQVCQSIKEFVDKQTAFQQVNEKIFAALKRQLVIKKTQHNRIV